MWTIGRGIVAAVIGLLLASVIAREAQTRAVSQAGSAATAFAGDRTSPGSLTAQAEAAFAARRFPQAQDLASRAVSLSPLNAAAVRTLGLTLLAQRQDAAGTTVMRLAAALGWRDTATQLWAVRDALERGDGAGAAQRADALARRRAELPTAYAVLRALALTPATTQSVVDRLGAAPPWRTEFLGDVEPLRPQDYAAFERLLAIVRRDGTAPAEAEAGGYVRLLVRRGDYARARRIWAGSLDDRSAAAPLTDGQFDRIDGSPDPIPFRWAAPATAEGEAAVDNMLVPGMNTIRVAARGTSTVPLVRQMLVLPAGAHRFTVDRHADAASGAAFGWTITCAGAGERLPSRVEPGAGVDGMWTQIDIRFVVPAAGCPAQLLALGSRAIDRPGDYAAWYRNARLR